MVSQSYNALPSYHILFSVHRPLSTIYLALSHLNFVSKFDMEYYLLFTFIVSFNAYKYLGKGKLQYSLGCYFTFSPGWFISPLMTHLDSLCSIWFHDLTNSHNDSLESLSLIPDYTWLIGLLMTPFASFQFFSILFSHYESLWFIWLTYQSQLVVLPVYL